MLGICRESIIPTTHQVEVICYSHDSLLPVYCRGTGGVVNVGCTTCVVAPNPMFIPPISPRGGIQVRNQQNTIMKSVRDIAFVMIAEQMVFMPTSLLS